MKLLAIRPSRKLSGAETYNITLLGELLKSPNIGVSFLTNLPVLAKKLKERGVSAFSYPWLPEEVGTKRQLLKTILVSPVFIVRYLTTIRALENGKRFDVICLESQTEMIFLTPVLTTFGYKVVWIQHGPLFISQAAGLIKWLYVRASGSVDKIVAVSEDTKNDLVSGGVNAKRVEVVYIGVGKTKESVHTKAGLMVGFLGTLTKEKGTEDFINVTRLLTKEKLKYTVIGDGPEMSRMKEHLKATYTGYTEDVKKYLGSVYVLVFPTHHYEGISMAILEAQAMGIPVLAYDKGGTREIITHGYNGFLYKEGDIDGMVRDIRMLRKNPKLVREMGKHARQRIVEKFTIEKQAKLFAEFFKSL